MKKAVLFHGTMGSPGGNWFSWFKSELVKKGITVWLPQLPNPGSPRLSEWIQYVTDEKPFSLDEDTIIIGHSSGASLALLAAYQEAEVVSTVIGISAFWPEDNEYAAMTWPPNQELFDVAIDWNVFRAQQNSVQLIHSDNDPYIPLWVAEALARKTDATLEVINGQGHFNTEHSQAYREFPWLLQMLSSKHGL